MLSKAASFLVVVLIAFYLFPKILSWYFSIAIDKPEGNYDFIIVGGGTSGCVVANRLSEDPTVRVLVLEAGGEDPLNPFIRTPFFVPTLQRSAIDWHYVTEPQKHSNGALKDNQAFWPRGKILGGTSSLNYLVYARGSRHDYDEWESLGATGWSYKEVLPYFKKSEHVLSDELRNSSVHGRDGYLKVETLEPHLATKWFFEAGKDLGYDQIDYNEEDEGFAVIQSTSANGKRQSAADAFLYPFAHRKNLDIVTHAHVTKVLFDTSSDNLPRAVGVEYVKNDKTFTVKSQKEVILSTGALATPQLLMLSGVGPKEQLKEHKISLVADLPGVGENLQDHPFVPVGFDYPSTDTDGVSMSMHDVKSLKNIMDYTLYGNGSFSKTGIDGMAFIKINKDDPEKKFDYPEVYLFSFAFTYDFNNSFIQQEVVKLQNQNIEVVKAQGRETMTRQGKDGDLFHDFFVLVTLGHPKSSGTIKLASSDYKDHPLIDPKYFQKEKDLDTFVKAMKFLEKLEETPAFKSRGIKIRMFSPLCDGNDESPRSAEYYKCIIRSHVLTQYHHTSTAKMGSPTDPLAVTSPRLKVYKVDGLRIADASVMPKVTSANTQAPCYMIGEKASDMIKEDWNLK